MPKFFDRIRSAIQNLVSSITHRGPIEPPEPPDWEDFMEDSIERARDIIMGYIESEQPYGEREEAITLYNKKGDEVYHRGAQYPSDRTGHTPISEGWNTEVNRFGNELNLTFTNESEHVWWVIEGTKKAKWRVPTYSDTKPLFWWGAPQKWPQKDAQPAGPRLFPWIEREKPEPNPFPSRVVERARGEVRGVVAEGIGDYIIEVIQSSGYRRR